LRRFHPFLNVPRFFADGDNFAKLEAKIRGVTDLVGWWQEQVPLSVMRIVSPDDFKRWMMLSQDRIS
jgi:hypothetical protein